MAFKSLWVLGGEHACCPQLEWLFLVWFVWFNIQDLQIFKGVWSIYLMYGCGCTFPTSVSVDILFVKS